MSAEATYESEIILKRLTEKIVPSTYEYDCPKTLEDLSKLVKMEIESDVAGMNGKKIRKLLVDYDIFELHCVYHDYYDSQDRWSEDILPENVEDLLIFIMYRTWEEYSSEEYEQFSLTDHLEKRSTWLAKHELE